MRLCRSWACSRPRNLDTSVNDSALKGAISGAYEGPVYIVLKNELLSHLRLLLIALAALHFNIELN